jgi:hypothetical protein
MEQLFLDNFRGFKNQYIKINDVNFLVGENSSGKSSVLYALKLISNPNFWFSIDFRNDESQNYSFEDLVSAESSDKSYFCIGYIQSDSSKKPSYIFRFSSKNGKPIISEAIIQYGSEGFVFYLESQSAKYKKVEGESSLFEKLKNAGKKDFIELKDFTPGLSQQPFYLITIINSLMKNSKNIKSIELPMMPISFVAPIRSKPKKTYDEPGSHTNSEGEHIPYELRRILLKKGKSAIEKNLNAYGLESGLFKEISIKEYESSDDAPFRMNVILEKEPINIVNVGYGISQVLPVIFEVFTGGNNKNIAIQQPEVHLHPRAQAALGDLFYSFAAAEHKKKLTIETHSDFIIDRFRQRQKKEAKKVDSQVIFFIRKNGINTATIIEIDDMGNYSENQPQEFRDFFIREEMANLGLLK